MTKPQIILVTGVSGHIGFRVLTEALAAGYQTRAALRKESQIIKIQENAAIQPYLDKLELAVIPDLTTPGAFDKVSNGLSAIIHVASPTFSGFSDVNVSEFSSKAWRVTESVLQFAANTPSVKQVVVTSSISAITPSWENATASTGFYTSKSPIMAGRLLSQPNHAPENVAYVLSKIYVADRVRKYVEINQPHFSIISILPGTTVGPNKLASDPKELLAGSNMVVLAPLLGIKFSPIPSIVSHVDDVAFAHVQALHLNVPSGELTSILPVFNSAADATATNWDDSIRIFREEFPEMADSGIFPFKGTVPTVRMLADSSDDERILGRKFKGYREAVVDLLRQYLELAANHSRSSHEA